MRARLVEALLTSGPSWIRERRLDPDEDPGTWRCALQRARIPDRYWTARPECVKGDTRWLTTALSAPEKWAGKGYGFFIHGPFNTGKTAVGAILLQEFIRRCHAALWLAVREIPGVRFHEPPLGDLDARLMVCDALVIDDLGSERYKIDGPAGAALEETVRIVTERGRALVITSNKSWDSFAATYAAAPAFVSVVQRHIIPISLHIPWPNAPEIPR